MIELMAPGAMLAMANWFPLEDAVLGRPNNEWIGFDGPDWAERIRSYASTLAAHPALRLTFASQPWLGLAVKVS